MSDIKQNLFYRTIQSFGGKFLDFIQYFLISYFLVKWDFDLFVYVFSLLIFVTLIAELWFSHIISKFVAENESSLFRIKILKSTLIVVFVFSLILLVLSSYFLKPVLVSKWILSYFLVGFIFVYFNATYIIIDGFFRWIEKFQNVMYLDLIGKTLSLLLLYPIISNFWLYWAVVSKWIYFVIPVFFMIIYLFFYYRQSLGWDKYVLNRPLVKQYLSLSFRMLIFNFFYLLFTRLDIIMLDYYWYDSVLWSYDISSQLFLFYQTFFTSISLVIAPKIAVFNKEKNYKQITNKLKKVISYSVIWSIIIALISFYPLKIVIYNFFSKYDVEIIINMLKLLLISLPFFAVWIVLAVAFLIPMWLSKWLSIGNILMWILNILLNYLLIPKYGYLWSVIWTCIIIVINIVFLFYYLFSNYENQNT